MSRNLVLVCLDTVRKDYFEQYAPRLQRRSSYSFDECRAAASWTTPSHGSMFTGSLPHQHGVHTHNRQFDSLSRDDTFLSELSDHRILGASANLHVGPTFGFDTLFDEFVAVTPYNRFPQGMNVKEHLLERDEEGVTGYLNFVRETFAHPHTLKSLANGAAVKLDSLSKRLPIPKPTDDGAKGLVKASRRLVDGTDEPFFLFVNFMDAHPPFQHTRGYDRSLHDAPSDWTSLDFDYWEVRTNRTDEGNEQNLRHFRNLYAASIDYLDRVVGEFLDTIQSITDEETTVIVTSDHGEDLGTPEEDYRIGHLGSLSEGLLHVPCHIVNPPDGWSPVDDGYFSHLDLGTLVQSLLTDTEPTLTSNRAVAEIVGGMQADSDAPLTDEQFRYWNRMQRCTYDGTRKVVWDSLGESTTYEVERGTSSSERRIDTDGTPPEWSEELFEVDIEEYKERARRAETRHDEVDSVTQSRLEDLGYV